MRKGAPITALLALLALSLLWAPGAASAQEGLSGAVSGQFLASEAGYGGGALVDLWLALGSFRLGGALGVGGIPSEDDARNRSFMPFALSLALDLIGDEGPGVSLRGRAGGWGGATQAEKVTAGGFFSVGAHFAYNLGHGALATIGMDVCFFVGPGEAIVFAPALGLAWSPSPSDP